MKRLRDVWHLITGKARKAALTRNREARNGALREVRLECALRTDRDLEKIRDIFRGSHDSDH